jgi:hypothetical protein
VLWLGSRLQRGHLLQSISADDSKRIHKFIESEDNAIIGEMYMVDCNVSGAKRRSLLVEDLQCLLDVHRFMDG